MRRRWAQMLLQLAAAIGLWIVALFGGAGRFDWLQGWIYLAAHLSMMAIAAAVVYRRNPGLFEARADWRHRDTKRFDKIFIAIFFPLYYVQPAIGGLDNARFRWWPLPLVSVYPGLLVFALSIAVLTWAMAVNPFAETTVRIQADRGQTVVTAGPYRFVRHPMYVSAILMFLAIPFILCSMWAFVFSAVICGLFLIRTALEDQTLQRELPGYEQYAQQTRYRLLPGVW